MTPNEFRMAAEANNRRTKSQMHMLAWLQANLMTMWAKKGKRVKISDLIKTNGASERPEFLRGGGPGERARFDEYMRRRALKA